VFVELKFTVGRKWYHVLSTMRQHYIFASFWTEIEILG